MSIKDRMTIKERNFIRQEIFKVKKAFNINDLKKINDNIRFKNKHKGERCFILGNGPSLLDVDFDLLSKERVFTVNNIVRVEGYEKLNAQYHIWMDYSFFDLRPEVPYDMNRAMKEYDLIAKNKKLQCFVPDIASEFFKRNKLEMKLNLNYIHSNIEMYEGLNKESDICGCIPVFYNVVQYAILLAVYMGFSEIYLLGCDASHIESIINTVLKKEIEITYAYTSGGVEDSKDINKKLLNAMDMTALMEDQYRLFRGYRVLNQMCEEKKIILRNCSTNTLITEVKREKIENVLQK